ncbi:MAG: UDP-N-acetylmuramate--L-alanine ligase [Firmicutes bacterium]|nr:UDP-N-acetylmuramate--L-alanine ligase [Bacillota bacterium]
MKKIHFIGIGGISMSGIAQIMKSRGYLVSGSDRSESDMIRRLEASGITVSIGQRAENITPDMDTIVYTAAVHEDNPELIAARASGARVIERAVMLGELLDEFAVPVGVAGTHGKTSTSSMLAYIYMAADLDPSVAIGGVLQNLGANYRVGHGDHMLIEACEYCDSFLHFHTKYNIITNIEAEHLDYFKDLADIQDSFHEYVAGMREGGTLITAADCAPLFKDLPVQVLSVSLDETADITAKNIVHHENALGSSFDMFYKGENLGRLDIYVPGRHLIFDALCAAAAAIAEGIPFESVRQGLANYKSTQKRFEYKGDYKGAKVVDDYAHHPSEIKATMLAAQEVPHNELYVVFQPHTFSRTIAFFDDFVSTLSMADHLILADIYSAREVDTGEVSSRKLADAIAKTGTDVHYFPTFDEIEKFLEKNISTNDLLITMGAGNAVDIANHLLSKK